nr:site-specific DNA-methyltransferase [Symmachiella dynata]
MKDGKADHITREPEQVKAFRDTWRDGIHSYLTYLRDRLTVARDLLADTGSVFVQIGDENLHRVRSVMDEVFGEQNFAKLIFFKKTAGDTSRLMPAMGDYIVWFAKNIDMVKFRPVFVSKILGQGSGEFYSNICSPDGSEYRSMSKEEKLNPSLIPKGWLPFTSADLKRAGFSPTATFEYEYHGKAFHPGSTRQWKTNREGMHRLNAASWLHPIGEHLRYRRFFKDFSVSLMGNNWTDTETGSFIQDKVYVVQTGAKVVERCLLMASDPGDLVIDPTCGSGTTAYVAEHWGRRWITIDTSRVALALARARIMGARYPYYLLADSPEGKQKEAEVTRTEPSTAPTYGNIRQGFVYERVPHITLKSIANNAEIDVIWEKFQETLEPLRKSLNGEVGRVKAKIEKKNPQDPILQTSPFKLHPFEEWEIPREAADDWSKAAKKLHADWWQARIARQQEIDASIAAKADHEYLYDKPYEDKKKVRVAGPFTVESISPHRVLGVDEDDELIDDRSPKADSGDGKADFVQMVLDNLQTSGVQQSAKADRITFTSISGWPGQYIAAEARYVEGESEDAPEKRAGIFIGPEFGTVARQDLVRAAREAGDAGFDVVIACAFNFDAHSAEFNKLGAIPVLKARMNADLHMADDLKNTGKGNLFVIFGEPDIDILDAADGQIQVKINGVDVFHPQTGEVHSDDADGIACWFVDTDYNEESFFVRHAYFLGANDPYKSLKTTLKAEIDRDAWESLNSDTSRPFEKPKSGRIAVKVINHLGDEVMKVFRVE